MHSSAGNYRSRRDMLKTFGKMGALGLASSAGVVSSHELLGQQVINPRDRAEFLARGQRRAASGPAGRPASSPPSKPERTAEVERDQRAVSPGLKNIASIESNLARYIGPIAKILIRRELEKHETLEKFYRALAAHIPDERDRENFLRAHGS